MKKKIRPILVTGAIRSGTTWLGNTISLAKGTAYVNEPFNPLTYKYYRGRCNCNFKEWFKYICHDNGEEYYKCINNSLKFNYDVFAQMKSNKDFKDFRRMIKEYCLYKKYKFTACVPVMKDPLAFFSSTWLARKFDTKVIIVIRHPAAFAYSLEKISCLYTPRELLKQKLLVRDYLKPFEKELNSNKSNQSIVDNAILLWKIIYNTVLKFRKDNPGWLFIRYEDIARDPVSTFRKIYDKLELAFEEHIRKYILDYTCSKNPVEYKSSGWSFRKRNSKANIDNWKSKLSKEKIAKIKKGVTDISQYFYSDSEWR